MMAASPIVKSNMGMVMLSQKNDLDEGLVSWTNHHMDPRRDDYYEVCCFPVAIETT